MSKDDLALTATGTPAIIVGDKRYPLVFTISGMKEWAEYKGQTFEQVMSDGWDARELSLVDIGVLVKLAMRGGEKRRVLFEGGSEREFSDELVEGIIDLAHPTELLVMLVKVWNSVPEGAREDPQSPASPSPGD